MPAHRLTVAITCVCLGLLLALGLARRWTNPTRAADLHPRPDAFEYEEAARNLIEGNGYSLIFDEQKFPPRYPVGFSLILVPALWFDGATGGGVRVALAAAAVAIILTWRLGALTGGMLSAAAAALFLAVSPLHVSLSQVVMSDVPSSALVLLLALWTMALERRDRGPGGWFALGAAIGLAASVRFTNAFLVPPIALTVALRSETLRPRVLRLASLTAGVCVGLAPVLWHHAAVFGSPWKTGYDFWVGARYLEWRFAAGPAPVVWTEVNPLAYARVLAGDGRLYTWPIAVLMVIGCFVGLRRRGPARTLVTLALGFTGALFAFHSFFFWQADRFFIPALPLLAVLAALPLGHGAPRLVRGAAVALALLGVVGTPRSAQRMDRGFREVAALRDIGQRIEPNAVLMVRTNPAFFERILRAPGVDRLWIPLGLCEWRRAIRQAGLRGYAPASPTPWILDAIEGPGDVARIGERLAPLMADGRPVYLAAVRGFDIEFLGALRNTLGATLGTETLPPAQQWGLIRVGRTPEP